MDFVFKLCVRQPIAIRWANATTDNIQKLADAISVPVAALFKFSAEN